MYEPMKARRDYLRLNKIGKSFYSNSFIVKYASVTDSEIGKIGITATKRLGNSVIRHRGKRRIKEVLRLWNKICPDNLLLDIVLILKNPVLSKPFTELQDEWDESLTTVKGLS